MAEFAPKWSKAKMTKAQVKAYIANMKKAQAIAKEKLKKAQNSWEIEKEAQELEELEKKLNDL